MLEVKNLSISFGGLRAVSEFDMNIGKGQLYGLIGPNGAGKTTIFNLLTGVYKPDEGIVKLDGQDITGKKTIDINKAGIARTFQNIRLFSQMSVLDNVKVGLHNHHHYNTLEGILRLPRYRKVEKEMNERAMELLKVFDLEKDAEYLASNLPYGQQRKLEIARALATDPKLLLLDEPAAGMNPNETAELIRSSHTTFLGPKIADKSYLDGYQTLLKNMGYRIWVTQAQLKQALGKATLILTWENDGTAPFYKNWPVVVTVTDSSGAVIEEKTLDWKISELMPGEKNVTTVKLDTRGLLDKARSDRNICVEIRDPMTEKAAVRLANKELDQKAQKKQMIVFKSGE